MDERKNPDDSRCDFFIPRKNRFCGMEVLKGERYCGFHVPERRNLGKRVPCPLDPSHTVYESRLDKHVKICNKKKDEEEEESLVCFSRDCNAGRRMGDEEEKKEEEEEILDVDQLYEIIQSLYQELNLESYQPSNQKKEEEEEETEEGVNKHEIQSNSLMDQMRDHNILSPTLTFVDYGAGKGILGVSIKRELPSSHVILVEKVGVRNKKDRLVLKEGRTMKGDKRRRMESNQEEKNQKETRDFLNLPDYQDFERIKIDIRHFNPSLVPSLGSRPLVALGKHVCGAATDLTLRSLSLLPISQRGGICLATCCHQRCSWEDLCGRERLEERGVTKTGFKTMLRWTSWAVCFASDGSPHLSREARGLDRRTSGKKRTKRDESSDDHEQIDLVTVSSVPQPSQIKFSLIFVLFNFKKHK